MYEKNIIFSISIVWEICGHGTTHLRRELFINKFKVSTCFQVRNAYFGYISL